MNRPMPSIGAQLRTIRLGANLRQEDLAVLIGVSQATVSHAERGGATSTDILERWALACRAQISISTGFYAEVEAAVLDLNEGDRNRLLRIAQALPHVPEPAKDGITLALEQLSSRS